MQVSAYSADACTSQVELEEGATMPICRSHCLHNRCLVPDTSPYIALAGVHSTVLYDGRSLQSTPRSSVSHLFLRKFTSVHCLCLTTKCSAVIIISFPEERICRQTLLLLLPPGRRGSAAALRLSGTAALRINWRTFPTYCHQMWRSDQSCGARASIPSLFL